MLDVQPCVLKHGKNGFLMAKLIPDQTDAAVGKRIQKRRKELGLTAEALSEKIGVSQQQFSRYECGRSKINVSHLADIAVLLDTPIDWFFADSSGSSKMFADTEAYVPVRGDMLQARLQQHWRRMSAEQKRNLINFLDAMQP